MNRMIIWAILLLVFAGCERTPTSPEALKDLTAHVILDTRRDFQYGVISRSMPANDFSEIYVNDATVNLSGTTMDNRPVDSNILRHRSFVYEEDYNYYARKSVDPGQKYHLQVYQNDSLMVRGETTVPAVDTVGFIHDIQKIEWRGSGAALYAVNIYKVIAFGALEPVSLNNYETQNYFYLTSDVFHPRVNYVFEVVAYDQNYVKGVFRGESNAGISKGRGLFSAVAANTFRYIPPKDSPIE